MAAPDTIAQAGLARPSVDEADAMLFSRGAGAKVYDQHERSYTDFILGYGSVVLGHNAPAYQERLSEYGQPGLMLPGYSIYHAELLEHLALPPGHMAAFFKTGSESVTAAMRLSAHHTGRLGIIRCGFLGWHDAPLASSPRWHERLDSPLRTSTRYIGPFRGVSGPELVRDWTTLDLDDLDAILAAYAPDLGCLLLDTYQIQYTDLAVIRSAVTRCRDRGLVVVADETKLSGRVNTGGLFRELGLEADLTIVGKALGNGAPISILFGRQGIMCRSSAARVTGTFSQELSAVLSALATRRVMLEEDGYSRLANIGHRISATFQAAISDGGGGSLAKVTPLFNGSMFEIQFLGSVLGNWETRARLIQHLGRSGVLALQGHASYVSLAHEGIDLDALHSAVCKSTASWIATL